MEQKNEKQLIYVKDLLFRPLYWWKPALAAGLILALLLGGYGILSGREEATVGGMSMTPQVQAKVDHLERQLARLDNSIALHQDYCANSPLMTMDPYNVCTNGYYLYVTDAGSTGSEYTQQTATAAAVWSYYCAITDSQVTDALAQKAGIDSRYLRELLTFDTPIAGCLIVSVKAQTPEQAKLIGDGLLEAAQSATREIAAKNPHQLSVTTRVLSPAYDTVIQDKQTAAYKLLTTYENERLAVETELKKYAPTQLTVEHTSPVILAAAGGVLGVGAVCALAWLDYLTGEKIYSGRLLQNRTGVRILGCVSSGRKRDPITRWLRKLEGRAGQTGFETAAATIRNLTEGTTLLIMGDFVPETLAPITAQLEKDGIRCLLGNAPATDPAALNALPQADAVVLAQVCGSSRYDSAQWVMDMVAHHHKPLLGCILIDG